MPSSGGRLSQCCELFGGLFGRLELSRSDGDLVREYEEKVAIYNALVQVAQKYGDVSAGNGTI